MNGIYRRLPSSLVISALVIFSILASVCSASDAGQGADAASKASSQLIYPSNLSAGSSAVLESATLILTKPGESSLIPYDERGFSEPVEASIAWWMNPDFMDNTSEFRRYLRATEEMRREEYSTETQIFFNFIERSLDAAEEESTLNETLILFRGISPEFADVIINNSEYVENAFASTAYDIAVCLDMFTPESAKGYEDVLVMQRSKGEHALFINDAEREFLIPRGTRWAVIKAVTVEKMNVIADFALHGCGDKTAQFDKVRLIYVKEIARPKSNV